MNKYEYISFNSILSNKKLNELGSEGWELIIHTAVMNSNTFGQYYVFKRIIKDE